MNACLKCEGTGFVTDAFEHDDGHLTEGASYPCPLCSVSEPPWTEEDERSNREEREWEIKDGR